jgi:hypothetical protein
MKMGTTLSPCPYDAAARHALQSANLRRPAILHYASWAAVFPISEGGPVTLRLCCKSRFELVIKNSAGCWRDFRVRT